MNKVLHTEKQKVFHTERQESVWTQNTVTSFFLHFLIQFEEIFQAAEFAASTVT